MIRQLSTWSLSTLILHLSSLFYVFNHHSLSMFTSGFMLSDEPLILYWFRPTIALHLLHINVYVVDVPTTIFMMARVFIFYFLFSLCACFYIPSELHFYADSNAIVFSNLTEIWHILTSNDTYYPIRFSEVLASTSLNPIR